MTYEVALAEREALCPECHGPIVLSARESVCQRCGLVVGPADHFAESERARTTCDPDGSATEEQGSFPDVSNVSMVDGRLRRSDLMSKHSALSGGVRAYMVGCLLAEALSMPRVQLSTALTLVARVKAKLRTRCRICDLLGAAVIISSRKVGTRKHFTIASVVGALNSMGYRTKPSNIMRALSNFKEQGLYVECESPEEHLKDILSQVDLSVPKCSRLDDQTLREASVARNLCEKVLSMANSHRLVSNPRSRAACSIYAGFRLANSKFGLRRIRISFSKIARASGLAEYTIRDNYERHFSGFELNFPV